MVGDTTGFSNPRAINENNHEEQPILEQEQSVNSNLPAQNFRGTMQATEKDLVSILNIAMDLIRALGDKKQAEEVIKRIGKHKYLQLMEEMTTAMYKKKSSKNLLDYSSTVSNERVSTVIMVAARLCDVLSYKKSGDFLKHEQSILDSFGLISKDIWSIPGLENRPDQIIFPSRNQINLRDAVLQNSIKHAKHEFKDVVQS